MRVLEAAGTVGGGARSAALTLPGFVHAGAATLSQLFTRPVARVSPYTTPLPGVFLCSASPPPGGGVHGMCGYHAAQAALRSLDG